MIILNLIIDNIFTRQVFLTSLVRNTLPLSTHTIRERNRHYFKTAKGRIQWGPFIEKIYRHRSPKNNIKSFRLSVEEERKLR